MTTPLHDEKPTYRAVSAPGGGSASDIDAILVEHREMVLLLSGAQDAMRATQHLFDLGENSMLILQCLKIERWLDVHQTAPNIPADFAGVRDGKIQPVVGDASEKTK